MSRNAASATKLRKRADHATMEDERVERDVRKAAAAYGDCFAMVVVAKKERAGALLGEGRP